MVKKFLFLLLVLVLSFSALAHEGEQDNHTTGQDIKDNALKVVIVALIILTITTIASLVAKKPSERAKWCLFLAMVIPIVIATFYIAGSTIYLNSISTTGGPVHWHADFEIYKCGEEVDLIDPTGLLNRVGTPVFHEHGDNRMHVEGTVIRLEDVTLAEFFNVVGGEFTNDRAVIPTNEEDVVLDGGCNGQDAELQVFVNRVSNPQDDVWQYTQTKVSNPQDIVLAPHAYVPPGDCIIIEYDQKKDRTDKLCETYKVAIEEGDLSGG